MMMMMMMFEEMGYPYSRELEAFVSAQQFNALLYSADMALIKGRETKHTCQLPWSAVVIDPFTWKGG
jgi:uncharacterized protein YhhL (DUF1145 family)